MTIMIAKTFMTIIRETVEHVRLALLVEDLAAQGERQVVATRCNMILLTRILIMMTMIDLIKMPLNIVSVVMTITHKCSNIIMPMVV